jgi:hypothetical protein
MPSVCAKAEREEKEREEGEGKIKKEDGPQGHPEEQ